MNIFDYLIESHKVQRKLCKEINLHKNLDKKKESFKQLCAELQAHAAAEERHFYIPLMEFDDGLDLSRHAIAEHHTLDELTSTLKDGRISEERWLATACELAHKVEHHLEEEEDKFFKQARKILSKEQIDRLGSLYKSEYELFKENL